MIAARDLSGAVLAGGRASRLGGANKAFLPLPGPGAGTPIARILRALSGRVRETIVVADDPAPYAGLPVRVIADRIPGCGPLGGIHAALHAARTPYLFVCACDMPALSAPLIDLMISRARPGRLLVPVHAGRPEPLHAIYPADCLDDADRALHEGVRMMLDFFDRVAVDYLPEEAFACIEGALRSFENINTPADLGRHRP